MQREHGPDSVAFLSTGQIPSEEMALLGAVAKFGMGFRHGDGNTRQCMATAVVAYKQAFGFDAPPYTYADFEASDVVVLVGSNLAVAHPIMWERLARNLHDPAIVVVDPRRTETAMAATQHVPVRPKADLELFYGLGHLLLELDAVDHAFVRDHTSGFDAYAAHVAAYPPAVVSDATGIPVEELWRLARTIAEGRARVVLVDDGREPVAPGRANGPGDHRPRAADGEHRPCPARVRTRSRVSATRWARGCSPTPPACSAGTPGGTRTPAPGSPRCWASTGR